MSTQQAVQLVPVPEIPFCKPCRDRGRRQVHAAVKVGNEWWCEECHTGGRDLDRSAPTFELVPEAEVPLSKPKSIAHQTLKALEKAPAGVAAKIDLKGGKKYGMQKHIHLYALRFGMKVSVTYAKGCFYVRREEKA